MVSKKARCGECPGCTNKVQFCASCKTCRNMTRFGGSGTMKKPCMLRMCSGPIHCTDNPVPESSTTVQPTENLAPQLSISIQPEENIFPDVSTNPASDSPPIQQGQSNTVLGFARTKTTSFFPARKIGELGKGHVRVQWLATGKVGAVPKDCWTIFSEQNTGLRKV